MIHNGGMHTQGPVRPSQARGYLIALGAAAILSTTAVIIRQLNLAYGMPALVLAFWRDLLVAATLVPLFAWLKPGLLRAPRTALPFLAGYGLVLALFNVLWTLSVTVNGAASATVLAYCSVAFAVILGRVLLDEPLGPAKLLATVLCLGGCVLVAGAYRASAWRANPLGILTGSLSGLAYAAYSLLGRRAARLGLDPWTTLLYIFAIAAGFLLLFNAGGLLPGSARRPADLLWLGRSLPGWGLLALLAAGPTVAGFGLYLVSLVHLPSSVANLVVSLEPAFTAVLAYLVLGERLTPAQGTGALMILGGVGVLRLGEILMPPAPAAPRPRRPLARPSGS
jgi:drug/metabolite transporter (DMT)-like permease